MIIAIDGTTASGKGTLARKVAERYGLKRLDTGAIYRGVALALLDAVVWQHSFQRYHAEGQAPLSV